MAFTVLFKAMFLSSFLFSTLIFFNLLQIMSFAVYVFSPTACWAFNRFLAGLWWGMVALLLEHFSGVKIELTGEKIPFGEDAILIPNHRGNADIPPLLWLARQHYMITNLKWFVKEELKWVPGLGWGLWLLGCPFLKRNWQQDRESVIKTLNTYQKHKIPIWMVIFPEGTRADIFKIDDDAIKTITKGIEPLHYHLFPKKAGIVATIQGLRGHVQAVYDVEILYDDYMTPSIWSLMMGSCGKITLHLRRIPIEDFPNDDEGIYANVVEIFRAKDHIYREHILRKI